MKKLPYAILILAGLTSVSTGAQTTLPAQDQTMPVPMAQLEPKTENGITYVCGGIGENEAAGMKQAASKYDLMLTFASTKGAYLADINVDIANARGNSVLKTTCDGPIMLVDFSDSGTYRIRAETEGRTLTRTAHIRTGRKVAAIAMSWPINTDDMNRTAMPGNGQPGGNTSSTGTSSEGADSPNR